MSELSSKLQSLGVPVEQADQLLVHIANAEQYIYPTDPGLEASYDWLKDSLAKSVDPVAAEALYGITLANKPDPGVEYIEAGYDSCQSHRKLSKVAAEAILLGGLIYESSILGSPMNLAEAQLLIGSQLYVAPAQANTLAKIAQLYGGKQDFLFPGVTPSSEAVPTIGEMAYKALIGKPETSVRTLTGVGGLRHDKEWNYVMALPKFVEEKIQEDKRYYPGMGIFYLLMQKGLDVFPAAVELKHIHPDVYKSLQDFTDAIKKTGTGNYSGVSVLCSAYLPKWENLKHVAFLASDEQLELAGAFHSPSYEFAVLFEIFKSVAREKPIANGTKMQLAALTSKLGHLWSFNSTIHLPWAAELAGLSNDYLGRITNQAGDYCIRYGIGVHNQSMEVREYHFGMQRRFPPGLSGKVAYEAIIYNDSSDFTGPYWLTPLHPGSDLWKSIKRYGFTQAAFSYITK